MEDIRAQLLAAFEVEHRDHLDAIRRALATPAKADLREVFRRAHSLKGAARAVDLPEVEDAAHRLENLFAEAMEGRRKLTSPILREIGELLEEIEAKAATTAPEAETEAELAGRSGDLVRVGVDTVEELSLAARVLSSEVQGQGGARERLRRLSDDLRALEAQWRALRGQLRQTEGARDFDHGLRLLAQGLTQEVQAVAAAGWALDQAASRVREQVEAVALTPAETVLGDLGRMVRNLGHEAGVEVEVHIEGLQTRAERRVIQALRDPIIHLLRNAISHGRESPQERAQYGKPVALQVGLTLTSIGGQLLVRVWDDGRGPDIDRIADAARARGVLLDEDGEATASSEEILALAFEPGLSASDTVDQLSGRGMGLSVVAETARALGGSATLLSRRPAGAEVRLSTPITTARQSLVLAEASGETFAIPAFAVNRSMRIDRRQVAKVDDAPSVRLDVDDASIVAPLIPLDALLSRPGPPPGPTFINALLLSRGDRWLAVVVDEIRDVADLVLETIAPVGVDTTLVAGAVRLQDGSPAAVLNPDALFDQWLRSGRRLAQAGAAFAEPVKAAEPTPARTVLVVDDSITTRTLQKSILEAHGYRVLLAVDGVDALHVLRSGEALIELVVADIEMPRMDGFSLLQAVKADAGLAQLPVILMTSRDDPQDIRRGMDLGAEAYITKQKFDQRELLSAIGRLL